MPAVASLAVLPHSGGLAVAGLYTGTLTQTGNSGGHAYLTSNGNGSWAATLPAGGSVGGYVQNWADASFCVGALSSGNPPLHVCNSYFGPPY